MMTSKVFLPSLFVLQLLEFIGCIVFIAGGHYWLAGGCILAMFAFTMPVESAYSQDIKMDVNSDILTILHQYDLRLERAAWQARGTGDLSAHDQATAEMEAFKQLIEVDPIDSRCIYRWRQ